MTVRETGAIELDGMTMQLVMAHIVRMPCGVTAAQSLSSLLITSEIPLPMVHMDTIPPTV